MGTELVPLTLEQYEARKKNMLRRSRELKGKVSVTLIGVGVIAALVLFVANLIGSFLFLTILFAGAGIGFFERVWGDRAVRRHKIVNLPNNAVNFPCPHCHQNINLANPWICGWCDQEHEDYLPGSPQLVTPIQGCCYSDCEITGTRRGDQAALQCPSCHTHIILDPTLYNQRQCHVSPFNGVARFVGDTSPPVNPEPVRSVYTAPAGSPQSAQKKQSKRKTSYFGTPTDR